MDEAGPAKPVGLGEAAARLREAAMLADGLFGEVARHFVALGRLIRVQSGLISALSGEAPGVVAGLQQGLREIERACGLVIVSLQQEDRMQQHLAAVLALLEGAEPVAPYGAVARGPEDDPPYRSGADVPRIELF